MINLLVYVLVLALVFGLIYWCLGLLPIPQPFKNIVIVVLVVIFILILLSMIGLIPGAGWNLRLQ